MSYFASIERLPLDEPAIRTWVLDFPQDGAAARVTAAGLYLQGWLLTAPGAVRGEVMLRTRRDGAEQVQALPFNNDRPDVIQRVLGETPAGHAQLRCGFNAHVPGLPAEFGVGVCVDGRTTWLCEVNLSGTPLVHVAASPGETQVIQGKDGWLYLDNDTNNSVDQYTGRLRLEAQELQRWAAYLDNSAALAQTVGARHAVVIAASKEQVLPEFYPHARAAVTVQEQVLGLARPEHRIVDTAAMLAAREDKEACFIKTDTHWTDRGALAACLAMLATLGLDQAQALAAFRGDKYYTASFIGDLGTKLRPPAGAPTEFLRAPAATDNAAFDNELPNIGRVLVYENAAAIWPHSLLLFGASSSYRMLRYLKRLFRRIVFVHSAGNVDPQIVRHERPDYLALQTTARFMITPPGHGFALADAVREKLGGLDERARARALASAANAQADPRNQPYCGMLATLKTDQE